MNFTQRMPILVSLLIVSLNPTLWAQEDKSPRHELTFEVISVPARSSEFYPDVTHIAEFHIAKDRKHDSWVYFIDETPQWEQLSKKQRKLCTKLINEEKAGSDNNGRTQPTYVFSSQSTPPGAVTFRVWGVSEKDVRIMAMAVIERLDWIAARELERAKEDLDRCRSSLVEAKEELPELEKEHLRLEQEVKDKTRLYAQANPGLFKKDSRSIFMHAAKTLDDVSVHLREVEFELIGLQAKQDSIQTFLKSGHIHTNDTKYKLEELSMINGIEQAGALARKAAYEKVFTQAKKVVVTIEAEGRVETQKTNCQERRDRAERRLPSLQKQMKNPPSHRQPVEVCENKVIIQPVGH